MAETAAQEVTEEEGAGPGEIEHGAYEVLKARLNEHAGLLKKKTESLNNERSELFGGQEISVIGNERIRTELDCRPKDIVAVDGLLFFGFNVKLGMKTAGPRDLFALHRFQQGGEGFEFPPLPQGDPRDLLADPEFVRIFNDIVKYYKEVSLRQLRFDKSKLVALIQTGQSEADRKCLEWNQKREGGFQFLGDKGTITYPPSHSFDWIVTTRDDHIHGTHPHVNILDKVFVECVGGDLTVKIEDNTEDGLGVYREKVEHEKQALHDAKIEYHDAEELILLRILPYREPVWRHLVYNTRDKTVHRIDDIGQTCIMLPENHGIVFPGGYYLLEGTLRRFDGDFDGMILERDPIHSPNGEDVLYVFRDLDEGDMVILAYNLVSREMSKPIRCHGFSLFDDGKMVVFRAAPNDEASKVHPMQIWQTPFVSAENYDAVPKTGNYLEKIGNADLVRGISDCFSICRRIQEQEASTITYVDLINQVNRTIDSYHWLGAEEAGGVNEVLGEVRKTAELVLTEFEKVETLRREAKAAVEQATLELKNVSRELRVDDYRELDNYVNALDILRTQRGHIITLKEMRYIDVAALDELESKILQHTDRISGATVDYLLTDEAFTPYLTRIDEVGQKVEGIDKSADIAPIKEDLDGIGKGLELLSEVVAGLKVDDPTLRTQILENISEVLSQLNRNRALVEAQRKKLGQGESVAEFGVQFKLFSQNVASSVNMADTPEKCDEMLSSLMLQLEELEAKFGEYDEFVADLVAKREEVYNSFSSKKQVLVDQRQRRVQQLITAGERILEGIVRRASTLKDTDKLNAYFASDPMIMKVRDLAERLRELNDPVKADELLAKLKVARQDSIRGLRDRQELFEGGDNVVKLGRHRFSLNTEPVELTLVPREGEMYLHITGTDYFEKLDDDDFNDTREYWPLELVSETPRVYRAEYLAFCLFDDAEKNRESKLSLKTLQDAMLSAPDEEGGAAKASQEAHAPLLELVRKFATERYDEGYDRGVHDVDAAIILEQLLHLYTSAGLLRYAPLARLVAVLTWIHGVDEARQIEWRSQCQSLGLLQRTFGPNESAERLSDELTGHITEFAHNFGLEQLAPELLNQAGQYLFAELERPDLRFTTSGDAVALQDAFLRHLERVGSAAIFKQHLEALKGNLGRQLNLAKSWLRAFVGSLKKSEQEIARARHVQEEAAGLLLFGEKITREVTSAVTQVTCRGLLGQHPRIHDRKLELQLDEFLSRLEGFRDLHVPGYRAYQKRRHEIIAKYKHRMRLDEYAPKVMSAFVRNKLINEVYLPMVGDNLAKQMGAVGDSKRTDLMGMLLLISPPGYGKTTLMEYIASRLGLVFVKVNGPSLGHSVTSLDPSQADNATSAQEVEKVNFGLEMANNVMLYLDDIQHCDPEFLQKFISLCDGQRRIEGVWKGRTRTYDLKGKRFCIIMAGNPYTESGGRFQIPDMLANRADTYNLGDVLSGKKELFELSYLENSLTSNPVLAPLAGRNPDDLYKLVRNAQGIPVPTSELSHNYSAVEIDEITSVLKKLLKVQEVLLKVNQEYIRSASMDDAYRTEPAFKLQGSYRNMNKMAEKVVPVMNDDELERVVDDHYVSESQTLTTGAEQNLLKLAELRGRMSETQEARWTEIKRGFSRNQLSGGKEDDPVMRVTNVLGLVSDKLTDIQKSIEAAKTQEPTPLQAEIRLPELEQPDFGPVLQAIARAVENMDARTAATPDLTPLLDKLDKTIKKVATAQKTDQLGPALERLAQVLAQQQPAAAASQVDLTPVLEKMTQTMALMGQTQAPATSPAAPPAALPAAAAPANLEPILEKLSQSIALLAQRPAPAAAAAPPAAEVGAAPTVTAPMPNLEPFMERLTQSISLLAQRPAAAPAAPPASAPPPTGSTPPAVAAQADLSPVLAQLGQAIQGLSQKQPSIDLRPHLNQLNQTLQGLANRPVQVHLPAGAAPPSGAAAAPATPAAPASNGGGGAQWEALVPILREIGEQIRGPKSKTIVMDPRLVAVFDGLRQATSMDEVRQAFEHLAR